MSGTTSAPIRSFRWLGSVAGLLVLPISLIGFAILWEMAASASRQPDGSYGLKPASVWFGERMGTLTATEIRTTQAAEAERSQLVKEAEMRGQLRAQTELQPILEQKLKEVELAFQTRLQAMAAELQRTSQAYESLHQRFNTSLQAVQTLESNVAAYQQRIATTGMAGGSLGAVVADVACLFGAQTCGAGAQIRAQQVQELAQYGRVSSIIPRQFVEGIEDPATMRMRADAAIRGPVNPAPALPQPASPAPGRAAVVAASAPAAASVAKTIQARLVRNPNQTWQIQLQNDGRAYFTYSYRQPQWASYTASMVNGNPRLCFAFDNGGSDCKTMRRQADNSVGWFSDNQAQTSSIITGYGE